MHKKEALNQYIFRVELKFRHFSATVMMHKHISCAIAIANEGYSKFYTIISPQLVILNAHNTRIVYKWIKQIGKLLRQK